MLKKIIGTTLLSIMLNGCQSTADKKSAPEDSVTNLSKTTANQTALTEKDINLTLVFNTWQQTVKEYKATSAYISPQSEAEITMKQVLEVSAELSLDKMVEYKKQKQCSKVLGRLNEVDEAAASSPTALKKNGALGLDAAPSAAQQNGKNAQILVGVALLALGVASIVKPQEIIEGKGIHTQKLRNVVAGALWFTGGVWVLAGGSSKSAALTYLIPLGVIGLVIAADQIARKVRPGKLVDTSNKLFRIKSMSNVELGAFTIANILLLAGAGLVGDYGLDATSGPVLTPTQKVNFMSQAVWVQCAAEEG